MGKVRLTKITDDVFEGVHPNGINVGYIKECELTEYPTVGKRFNLGTFSSSTVIDVFPDGTFVTLNSTYKITDL